ncbi:uncharacterized protein LOC126750530 [Anthonomus grandis grandis]|uniref:uncharacterized protein LOC126750530 n=1 Tax=Anthonomus grandis grandis TaxID=2921223 RepID=UPI0021668BF8|nr:uncharacterized protein LOC126750530 [Anthonomus grandis grandis]
MPLRRFPTHKPKFTIKLYGDSRPGINEVRKQMFASDGKHLASIPLTCAALEEHIKRAAYVAGHIWGCANLVRKNCTSPEGWGWTLDLEVNHWKVLWSKLPQVWKAVRALDRCGCVTGCETLRCSCRRQGLPSSPASQQCMGDCSNKG